MNTDTEKRYCLIQDDSCHWYLCPAEKRDEANARLEAISQYWEGDMDGDPPDEPEYLERLDRAPYRITFANYKIES